MVSAANGLQDQLLPAHKRRTGRIASLHEFQQRAASYDHEASCSTEDFLVDVDARSEDADFLDAFRKYAAQRSMSSGSLFGGERERAKSKRKYYRRQLKAVSFLVLLGVIGGPLNYGIRRVCQELLDLRDTMVRQTTSEPARYFVWTGHTVVFSLVGLLITRIAPVAAGSGVSQMKAILTGIDPRLYLPGYFDFATLVTKILGLICSVGAGLVVGTEGCNAHIMSIVTHHLLRLPVYSGFSSHLNGRIQLLAAACAVGVSSLFSSPVGGVLFSMEVTATYYLTSNYVKAFISAVSGAVMLRLTLVLAKSTSKQATTAILATSFGEDPFSMWEIPLYMLMGAILGLLCTAMIKLLRVIAETRRDLRKSSHPWKRVLVEWVDPFVVAVLCGTLTYVPGEFAHSTTIYTLSTLFTESDLPKSWYKFSKFYTLSVLAAVFMFLLPVCISLKMPTGVWVPTFIGGAAFGRLFGEMLSTLFPSIGATPGAYALAGAAAFGGAATKAVSVAVITLEITGEMSLILPIFCAVLAAMAALNLFKERSVYDTLLVVVGTPFLPIMDFESDACAGDIVEVFTVYITKRTTLARLLLALHRLPNQDIPVVQDEKSMVLLGVVSSTHLKKFVRAYYLANDLDEVEQDLGEEPKSTSTGFSWATIVDGIRSKQGGGLNGDMSIDETYSALTSAANPSEGSDPVPFLMNDEKMLALLSDGWSAFKRAKLNDKVKITESNACVIQPLSMTISSRTSLGDVHMLFTMLRCDHCFVCNRGALEGVVTMKGLLHSGKTYCNS
ncbi:Dipeptidyl peptidase 2 [Phytophthora pseudosyringae]|uniref:Dipeptidyl peptidase 2 n=1 Tax=Phytophthora pseudosyringae TaxID=221518 RepID=A0A8T1VRF1_9STRA|nr:Dipeptidyl peptidase 2 [Phytophthora pseudosyringae]